MDFHFPRSNVFRMVLAFLLITTAYSCKIYEEHQFEIPISSADEDSTQQVRLTIVETGQWVFAVDGGFRDSHFSEAKYATIKDSSVVELDFLTVENPIELWDSFAKINETLYAIDVAASAYRSEPAHIKVVKSPRSAKSAEIKCEISDLDCNISGIFLKLSGEELLIDNKFGRYYACSLVSPDTIVREISEEEFLSGLQDAIKLENEGVFINMGASGTFGLWCQ